MDNSFSYGDGGSSFIFKEEPLEDEGYNHSILLTPVIDDDLAMLLKEWNLYDELYAFLKERGITIDGLRYMKIRHLDELFNGVKLNEKIILEHKLADWQNAMGVYNIRSIAEAESESLRIIPYVENVYVETSDASSPIESSASEVNNIEYECELDRSPSLDGSCKMTSVRYILLMSEQCKLIVNNYKDRKMLFPTERTAIVHCITQHYLERGWNIPVSRCKELAEEIIELFPTECIETYFLQLNKKFPPKGKLWNSYQTRKRSLNRRDVNSKKSKLSPEVDNESESSDTDEYAGMGAELKYLKDWEEILRKWKTTIPYRQRQIRERSLSLEQIFAKWPLFKGNRSPQLIEMDYRHLYPGNEMNFSNWKRFCAVADKIFKKQIKDGPSKALMKEVLRRVNVLTADNLNIYYFKLLHAVLVPTSMTIDGRRIKYSINDSQASFTLEVRQASDFDAIVMKKREQCIRNNEPIQPLIIVVGKQFEYGHYYVLLDDIKYSFKSYLQAIEYCFKLMCVLNIKHPNRCLLIWQFIEKFMFNMPAKKNAVVDTFINDVQLSWEQ